MTAPTAMRARGLVRSFADAGVLSVADVHVAARLAALTGESDDSVVLAAALVVRGTRHGSVVLDLATAAATVTPEADDGATAPNGQPGTATAPDGRPGAETVPPAWPPVPQWVAACAASPLVTAEASVRAPLRIVGSRLWLDRYWQQEAQVAEELLRRAVEGPDDLDPAVLDGDLGELFADGSEADQRHATSVAARSRVSVVLGGPGTGKTTTIARLITVLCRQRPDLRIALAAPTGKAAARLAEAMQSAAGRLTDADRARLTALSASTLHRLLGRRPGTASRFRHDRNNRLPFDVVVVDEASMVSLTLMARLLEALPPHTRLVLVGDPDQLASVEAGAVLGDLVDAQGRGSGPLRDSVAVLRTGHRFAPSGPIAQLAEHTRAGRAAEALALLTAAPEGIAFHAVADDAPISGRALAALRALTGFEHAVIEAARAGDVPAALHALDAHRLLCAHRLGPRGVLHWGAAVERWLAADDPRVLPRLDGRYAGQPLLVTRNDYQNGLFNGDTGVVVQQQDELVAGFRREGAAITVPLSRLADVRPLHAMTVHRAQGSQFEEVTVVLPAAGSPLATRQTFYTAITRARSRVQVIGSAEAVLACVAAPAARATGLRDRLAGAL